MTSIMLKMTSVASILALGAVSSGCIAPRLAPFEIEVRDAITKAPIENAVVEATSTYSRSRYIECTAFRPPPRAAEPAKTDHRGIARIEGIPYKAESILVSIRAPNGVAGGMRIPGNPARVGWYGWYEGNRFGDDDSALDVRASPVRVSREDFDTNENQAG